MSFKFISLIALLYLSSALCPVDKDIQNLVSGTLSFVNSNLTSQDIIYTFPKSFTVVPKVALAIQHFDVTSGNHGNFSIVPSSIRAIDINFKFTRTSKMWNKLRFNFFASLRSDLIIGSSSSTHNSIFNTTAISTVDFSTEVPNYSRSIIRVFLNGYEYKGSVIDIQISGRKLDAKQLSISIDVENDFYLSKLYYSYVVFAPSSVTFASYGGLIAQTNFTGFYYEDVHKIIYNSNYQLYGLNKVTLSGTQSVEFASSIDENQVAGVYSSGNFDELNLIYIILGVSPASACSKCSTNQFLSSDSNCLASCPSGSYPFQYNDKGSSCRVCSYKLNQVLSNGKCVCNSNSMDKDGVCYLTKGSLFNFLTNIKYTESSSSVSTSQVITTTTTTTTTTTSNNVNTELNTNINTNINTGINAGSINNTAIINTSNLPTDETCSAQNQYWTGYRCACKVGFKNQSDQCVRLGLLKTKGWIVREPSIQDQNTTTINETQPTPVIQNKCYMQYEYFNGQGCVCINNYNRVNGICVLTTITSNTTNQTQCLKKPNRQFTNNTCSCIQGYILVNGECLLNSNNNCPINSYDNGLGVCICDQGYYKDITTNKCIQGTPCPPFSTRNTNGTCICDADLTLVDGYCTKCQLGAIFDTQTSKCNYVCGQKAAYNQTLKRCICESNYGIYDKVCTLCPNDFFIRNNYCVKCPQNSVYNSSSTVCQCSQGYQLNQQGFCIKKCLNNQNFDSLSGTCRCLNGLGRIISNSSCLICSTGTVPNSKTQICQACLTNQVLIDGKCLCKVGFVPNSQNICVNCTNLPNAFILNGACNVCAGDLVYNKNSSRCQCNLGKFKIGSKCFDSCKTDQLIDDNNNCYKCPINEVISNGKCECKSGYVRNAVNNYCEIKCKNNQFVYRGVCAVCPLNLQYRKQINGCACADGTYLNNYGTCEKVVLTPITCSQEFFFNDTLGCVACPAGCSTCKDANTCTSCSQAGFAVNSGKCLSLCGDGLIILPESCDDGNTQNNDGCSNTCRVEPLYTCTGQPSICKYNGPAICGNGRVEGAQTCDDGNTVNNDGCSSICQKQSIPQPISNSNLTVVGQVNTNINNVFIVLKTPNKYTFSNQKQMSQFIKTSIPDSTYLPIVYCSQRDAPDLDLFDCLAIYSSGIPNKKFNMVFTYNYSNGDSGKLQVQVDPLKSSGSTRAIRGL